MAHIVRKAVFKTAGPGRPSCEDRIMRTWKGDPGYGSHLSISL